MTLVSLSWARTTEEQWEEHETSQRFAVSADLPKSKRQTDCSVLSCRLMDMSHRREEELIFITTHHQRGPKSLWRDFARLPYFLLIFREFFCSVMSSLVYIVLSQHDSEVNIPPLLLLYAVLSGVMKMSGRPPRTKNSKSKEKQMWQLERLRRSLTRF